MKKYLWLGFWLCLISAPSLVARTIDSETQSDEVKVIEGNYLVSKVSKTHKILEIPPEVKANFSDKTILTVYETGESVTIKDGRQETYSLFTYHYVQPEKTLAFIDGNFYMTNHKKMGQSVEQFLWTVVLPIFLIVASPLWLTTIPFKSLTFFLFGLIFSIDKSLLMLGIIVSLVFFLAYLLTFYQMKKEIFEGKFIKDRTGNQVVCVFTSMFFMVVGPFTIHSAVRVANDLYVLPSLMLEFAILSLILFVLEVAVYQWSNRSKDQNPINSPMIRGELF